jgi:hypothetical protein
MGCSDSNSVETNYKNSNYANDNVDTDDFFEGDYPFFQPNYYDKNIKNIKKYYVERINEGNKIRVKIHKILILMNYEEKNTTTIQIEIEKLDGRAINKHLTQLFYNECSLDNVRSLIEIYNSTFKIDSREWYKSKSSSDIYIRVEKLNNYFFKIFEMFYEKDISRLILNRIIKYGNSELSSEAIFSNYSPGDVVKRYNKLQILYYDNKTENCDYIEEPFEKDDQAPRRNNNYYRKSSNNNYSNYQSYSSDHDRNDSKDDDSKKSVILRDIYGQENGRVDRNGNIKDYFGVDQGKFDNDGTVRDTYGQVRGYAKDGYIKDHCNREVGKVRDGVVSDSNGNEIGRIRNGEILDENNNVIGKADGLSDEQAAYLHFFNK